ncbi:MAG: 5-histidylcysteine sulfoxide synthase [Betaproteobacteria bacterium]|nr:5-histidylcysteine sulfoxide synthase [Betaproteobacteria bacterium]MDE2151632.1 5-histidylcysteine sulfoxide synthase [Betaproteobacteria bacterium]
MRSIALADPDPQRLRERVLADFHASFDRYESLFEVLQGEQAFTVKPIALRHPLIFYLGHTATFFINKLVLAGVLQQRIDPRLESMFAVGVDEMSWDDLDEAHYDWPSSAQVRAYRDRVRQSVDRLIRELPLSSPIAWDSPWWVILMGIEHERIHLETSSVLIRQHRLEFVRPHPHWQPCPERGEPPANELVPVAAASFRLGRDRADPGYYGWDNEFGEHVANTAAFQAARHLVSNREFLEFVQAGGYADDSLWSEEGAAWKAFARAEHPSFWLREGAHWKLRLMCEVADMPWNWPVETNFHEAQAFCNWKARRDGLPVRLPSEDEWHALRRAAGIGDGPQPRPAAANFELDHWASSCPVDRFAHGPFFDVVGNAWQWLDTPTYPFPGFQVHPIYDDFTTPTFDERHNLIKGGSWVSCGNQALPVSRYAFRRHFFQHAGFRYVVGERPEPPEGSMYETDALVSQYCEFHWGAEPFGVPNFPRALAEIAVRAMQGRPMRRALDLGCATGRASFELARHFEHVVGIDFSARFIGVGTQLAEQGRIRYQLPDEGELVSYHERSLREYGLQDLAGKVEFVQGDACNLKPTVRDFDLVLAANLIDRLYSPARFLREVHRRIVSGGMLVITSPYTWLEEHTRREEWVGGFKKDGENFSTLDGLEQMLGEHFERVGEPLQVPFVIRETRRKFQHTVSELTVWRRR